MKLTTEHAELLLFALKAGRAAARQLALASLDDLPAETRAELEAEGDAIDAKWKALAPSRGVHQPVARGPVGDAPGDE